MLGYDESLKKKLSRDVASNSKLPQNLTPSPSRLSRTTDLGKRERQLELCNVVVHALVLGQLVLCEICLIGWYDFAAEFHEILLDAGKVSVFESTVKGKGKLTPCSQALGLRVGH